MFGKSNMSSGDRSLLRQRLVWCVLLCENPGFRFGPGTKRQHTRKKCGPSNKRAEWIRWSLRGLRISNLQIFLPSLICFPATTHCFSQPLFSCRKSGLAGRTCRELKKAAMETLQKSLRNRRRLWSQPVQTTQGDIAQADSSGSQAFAFGCRFNICHSFSLGVNACLGLESP